MGKTIDTDELKKNKQRLLHGLYVGALSGRGYDRDNRAGGRTKWGLLMRLVRMNVQQSKRGNYWPCSRKRYHNLHDSKDMQKIAEEINKAMKEGAE